jgi:hypothetical protein
MADFFSSTGQLTYTDFEIQMLRSEDSKISDSKKILGKVARRATLASTERLSEILISLMECKLQFFHYYTFQ